MLSKLKVEELRAQLSKRGLDTSGTKQILLRRLDNAIMEEKTSPPKKRKREDKLTDHGDENEVESKNGNSLPSKSEIIKSPSNMNVRELRKELEVCRLLTSGLKKELIERLTTSVEMDGDLTKEDATIHDVDECKKEKLVKATKKGGSILHQWLSDDIKLGYHVLQIGDEIYDAVLNQTNVGQNNNKFYVIQALGRFSSLSNSKFVSKAKNNWSDRKIFTPYAKSYTWLEMDYSEDTCKNKADQDKHNNCIVAAQPRKTRLRIAEFISLICNVSMMKQQMLEIGYNAEKLPLRKLSKSTITKGYDVLKRIADVIGQPDRLKLEQLSGKIPFTFTMDGFIVNWYHLKLILKNFPWFPEKLIMNDLEGLRIAPPEAPVTGYMFGKGVYFSDMFSKSSNYCYSSHSSWAGVLLLCQHQRSRSNCPDPSGFRVLEDGVIVPLGKPKKQSGPQGSLLYNEYIVYNVDQIRMRYVLQLNFNFKH
ncbi:hypothetical protein AMTR_s00044p00081650 [Amborella trichopoda]|uniref:Poly [ADP-ribose] polymerase n=1 Tax=Amborella trichopoda TaxID=13333 RepID=U5D9N4_AMBTC|nr:hypothetical protein AMTR_s00044p00081650 [Amborella trichopoda]